MFWAFNAAAQSITKLRSVYGILWKYSNKIKKYLQGIYYCFESNNNLEKYPTYLWFGFFVYRHISFCWLFNAKAILADEQQEFYLIQSWEE